MLPLVLAPQGLLSYPSHNPHRTFAGSTDFYCFKASLSLSVVVSGFCFVLFVSLGFLQPRLTSYLHLPRTGAVGLRHQILLLLS